tara:strand:- start:42 stop:653 length:612 start_codon:yes stop_codon:yes gene_type:complete
MEENSETEEQKNKKSEEAPLRDETPIARENEEEANPADQDEQALIPEGEKSLAEENSDLRDRLLRALAENENLIRRGRREREDAIKYAATNFARDMLAVSDNLSRALAALSGSDDNQSDSIKALLEGVKLTEKELLSSLERHGVSRIVSKGEQFDHERHEALFEVPSPDMEPGIIVEVVEEGYMIHDRLLRPARVGVSKKEVK